MVQPHIFVCLCLVSVSHTQDITETEKNNNFEQLDLEICAEITKHD